MKVLVTGGTGFLGTALVRTLKSSGHEVILTTRKQENTEQGIYNLGDISADTNWINLLQGCDTVIHTAGRAHILNDDAQDALAEFRRVNHDATMKLARDAATSGVKHFIFVSSIGVNGNATSGSHLLRPRSHNPLLITPFPSEKLSRVCLINLQKAIWRSPLSVLH
jgi:nucleoside-diphosphate-sugar epimerase